MVVMSVPMILFYEEITYSCVKCIFFKLEREDCPVLPQIIQGTFKDAQVLQSEQPKRNYRPALAELLSTLGV